MVEQLRGLTESVSLSRTPWLSEYCKKIVPTFSNRAAGSNEQQFAPASFIQLLSKHNLTLNSLSSVSECVAILTHLLRRTNEPNITLHPTDEFYLPKHSKPLIVFVVLIALFSFISVMGNLCLAKVLYSKRRRLLQTDRIVLCLALSELCLVLIDSPTEIYRLLSPSFTQEWLCPLHTFFEAFLSSCIIFYHLLGALDRFIYVHGHTSSRNSFWSKWSRRISTKSGSIILLTIPIICSLPLAICNSLYTSVVQTASNNKICIVQYRHGILIGLLIASYLLPLLFSFFLHGKLICFIRTRHNQYFLTATSYVLPMKRNNPVEFQSNRRMNNNHFAHQARFLLEPKHSSHRRVMLTNTENLASTTTTTMNGGQSARINRNNSSNSSRSSRSSTGTSSTSVTSPIVLYKINTQANANANRTVLLLVLLLSFYVFCWAPYNIYTWRHAYLVTQSSSSLNRLINTNSFTSLNDSLPKLPISFPTNLHGDLRRFIYINYSLYLLSMISMCFSFIFYFSLNKQARQEFTRFIGCMCPWIARIRNEKPCPQQQPKQSRQLQYRAKFPYQYSHRNDRIKTSSPSILNDRYNHFQQLSDSQNARLQRRALNYGCQVQCCP